MSEPPDYLDRLARAVIGAAIEVHRRLGPGFLESIYEAALVIELNRRGIHFEKQLAIVVRYEDVVVGEHRLDLLVEGELVVELKAVEALRKYGTLKLMTSPSWNAPARKYERSWARWIGEAAPSNGTLPSLELRARRFADLPRHVYSR